MSFTKAEIKPVRQASFTRGQNVVLSDVTTYSPPFDALVCRGNGVTYDAIVRATNGDGETRDYPVLWGVPIYGSFSKVHSTGTTSTGVVGLKY